MGRLRDDPDFEGVFSGEHLIRNGDHGRVVEKLQQALLDAGHELPRFGADGDFGAETVSAVREFQRDNGLSVDGIVGPETIRSLDERLSGGRGNPEAPTAGGNTLGGAITAEKAQRWRDEIVRIAEREENDWTNADGTKKREGDSDRLAKLEDYYGAVFSGQAVKDRAREAHRNKGDWSAWSAVFISYVVKQAGVSREDGFEFSSAHMRYMVHSLANRLNGDRDRPFWLYDIDELTPEPGDILCVNRKREVQEGGKSVWVCLDHSFDSLRNRVSFNSETGRHEVTNPDGRSHSDIVVRKFVQDGVTYIETVGGNTGDLSGGANTVGRKRWKLDANGHIEHQVRQDNSRITNQCSAIGLIRITPP